MRNFADDNVINGTFGELWIDNDYMAEVIGFEAKLKLDTVEITRVGTYKKGAKVTGTSGSGTVKLNKVSSYFVKKISENLKQGKTTRATITSKLGDPGALGTERIVLKDCVFTEVTLADWEAGKNLEESIPFTFGDHEILEAIEV